MSSLAKDCARFTTIMSIPPWIQRVFFIFRDLSKEEIPLIEDQDLQQLMDEIGVLEDFRAGRLRCSNCSRPLSQENLAGFFIRDGVHHFICDLTSCISEAKDQ